MHRKITACSNTARLNAEIRDAMEHQDSMVHLQVNEDNIYHWTAYIKGPEFTPYEKGTFVLKIICDSSFPISPPSVTFKTPVFHPNINSQTGEVCMDVLKEAWSPIWTLSCLCRAIISLLEDPNPHSPLCCDAGNLIRTGDLRGFQSLARMYTIDHATEVFPCFNKKKKQLD